MMKWRKCGFILTIFAALCLMGFSRFGRQQNAAWTGESQAESGGSAAQESAGAGETAGTGGDETKSSADTIVRGVKIGEVDVGGLTEEEARAAVESYFGAYEEGTFCLSFDAGEAKTSLEELGISWDNPEVIDEAAACGRSGNMLERYKEERRIEREEEILPFEYSIDEELLRSYLSGQAQQRDTPAVDAKITRSGDSFEVTPSSAGLSVDVEATLERVQEAIAAGYEGGQLDVEAVVTVTEPKYREEELLLIQDCLGEHSTSYNANSADRSQNLVNGTGFINGVVLLPGETLSLYDYLYPCTEENGYRSAIAYADGGYVDSIGGGICQISTTLYNALLKAELKVLTRSPHSMTVTYAEPGFDSAQSEGNKDLSFMNSTDYPVYIEAWASGGELHTALWGKDDRPDNREVVYYNEIISRVSPGDPIYTEDPSLPAGTTVTDQDAYDALKAALYKQVLVDGQVVETTLLHTDRYRASPAKIRVGTGAAEEPAPEQEPEQQEPEQQEPAPPQE